jgi:hypothetical protein
MLSLNIYLCHTWIFLTHWFFYSFPFLLIWYTQKCPLSHSHSIISIIVIVITIIITIGLGSTNEWEYVIFGFLSSSHSTLWYSVLVISLQMTWFHFSFMCVCIYVHTYTYDIIFSLSIHQLFGTSSDSTIQLLWAECFKHGYACISLLV